MKTARDGDDPMLVAFIDGFGWLWNGADPNVRFDTTRFPAGPTGDELRTAIEAFVRVRQHPCMGEIAPGFTLHVNG